MIISGSKKRQILQFAKAHRTITATISAKVIVLLVIRLGAIEAARLLLIAIAIVTKIIALLKAAAASIVERRLEVIVVAWGGSRKC